ncbi:ATP-binding protein [Uliginosibacterium sp. H1]|uniref:ATP-binding protein n=1 Tax=Uliginosibacterium sp. H1 TaxID=3114757 RepID=UPI002E17E193|nr:AAA family ATPase [Uliginosibacterium sp. H1]
MFHIREIELVHWDFWRRFTVPLDAQIITIVGPNGSGKTTLLDAMRTLFALKCSGKRDYRRYVRRSNHGFAWIRATVANTPSSTGKRPFFPCMKDVVTLACRIKRAGGDWTREYCIEDGLVSVEELEEKASFAGLRDYQHRLAFAGLSPAIAKVLSLEQGDTDKLCEYSPRHLLDLVFDVFGDKEVLDNYETARQEQKGAQRELDALALDLEKLRAQAEAKRLEADRYAEWKGLASEVQALDTDVIPRLEVGELREQVAAEREQLAGARKDLAKNRDGLDAARSRLAGVKEEKGSAESAVEQARIAAREADAAWQQARDAVRDLEKVLEERNRLREQLAREHGEDAVALEKEHEQLDSRRQALRNEVRTLETKFEDVAGSLRAARSLSGPPGEPEVNRFRQTLRDEGIAHAGLAEIVNVRDARWQGAVEAILRPYRHLVLLEDEGDRHMAWAMGERERFRHFIVAERAPAPKGDRDSLLAVVEFTADPPRWLADLLGRIQRVEDAAEGASMPREQEWITREGYHRERRGARHLGVPTDFWFGELAKQARVDALDKQVAELDAALRSKRPQLEEAEAALRALRGRLIGLQAAQLLATNAERYNEADAALPAAREKLNTLEAQRSTANTESERRADMLRGVTIEIDRRERDLRDVEQHLGRLRSESAPRRHEQAQRLLKLRRLQHGIPADWLDADTVHALSEQYAGAHGARNELSRLKRRLADGDWVTDDSVVAVRDKLALELTQRERDAGERLAYCERTRVLVDEARAAYIAKLRATVRQYGKNLRALGELAGVNVECPLPVLDNDDATLHSAGLEVQFDFDQKGAQSLNDGEASGGQQVMKSLILLIGLLMDEARPGGFVFIDEPFAHLDVANIDKVGAFLRATRAQYLITTPVTHNANVFQPAQLTLVTRKKRPSEDWAPAIGVLKRQID